MSSSRGCVNEQDETETVAVIRWVWTILKQGIMMASAGWPQCATPAGFHGSFAVCCSHGDSMWYVDFILALQSLQFPFRSQDE